MHHQAQTSYFIFHVPSYLLGLSVVSSTFVAPSSVWNTEEEGASGSKAPALEERAIERGIKGALLYQPAPEGGGFRFMNWMWG